MSACIYQPEGNCDEFHRNIVIDVVHEQRGDSIFHILDARSDDDTCVHRYIIRRYDSSRMECKDERIFITSRQPARFTMENVSSGEFIAIWCEVALSDSNKIFDSSDFRNIIFNGTSHSRSETECFSTFMEVQPYSQELPAVITLTAQRQLAEFIFTDSSCKDPVSNGLKSVIHFADFYANVHDLFRNKAVDASPGITIENKITANNESILRIAEGACFMASEKTTLSVWIEIIDSEGNTFANSGILQIPLRKGSVTIVDGPFMSSKGDSGIAIDPSFSGSYEITIY